MEIKFKLWSYVTKSMSPVIGIVDMCYHDWDKKIDTLGKKNVEILQFTGLIDRNDREIYVGDIVKQEIKGRLVLCEIVFDENRAKFGGEAYVDFKVPDEIKISIRQSDDRPEIMGNKFENPELLEKK